MKKIFLILLITGFVSAQSKDPEAILNQVKQKFEKIKDYTADVVVKVDVDFLKMPDSKAKIFFKQPDKIHLESDGFAMLPKAGFNFSPTRLLEAEHEAVYVKSEKFNDRTADVIKVIPLTDSTDVVLSTLWIDSVEKIMLKIESTTKNAGTFQMEMKYENTLKLGLPSEVKFLFNIQNAHTRVPSDIQNKDDKSQNKSRSMAGTVIVKYSNYKVNSGLSDSIFKEEEKK